MPENLRKKIGQFFVASFEGVEPPPPFAKLVCEQNVGGVILFASNCPSVKATHHLISHLKSLSRDLPLMVAIDHEGGSVHRLPKPVTHFPPLAALGRLYERMPSVSLAKEVGKAMATELKAIGVDLNLAPVADVQTNPFNPVIGDRAASTKAEVVARVVGQMIEGMQASRIAACAKHFPGHGDTNEDSHKVLPHLPHNLKRLHSLELIPFKEAIQKKVASIMPAHVVYDGIDKDVPATFSKKILRDLLREGLRFGGVVISDSLTMGAIANHSSLQEAAIKAFLGGCDLLLVTHKTADQIKLAIEAFLKAIEQKQIPLELVEKSFQRIELFKKQFCKDNGVSRPSLSLVGSKGYNELLNKIKHLA